MKKSILALTLLTLTACGKPMALEPVAAGVIFGVAACAITAPFCVIP